MRKLLGIMLAVCVMVGSFSLYTSAKIAIKADINITLTDSTGKIVLAQEKITVTDRNGDEKFDIDEALFAAHEAKYEGGAAEGYATAVSEWGLGIIKLWGDTSGNFGYYVNNASAWSLSDEVKEGDYLNAFIYQKNDYSDVYTYFDKNTISAYADDEISVTVTDIEFDPVTYAPLAVPASNAVITIDGEETSYKTDAQGKVTFKVSKAGDFVISAKSTDKTLVPPVLKVSISEKPVTTNTNDENKDTSPKTNDVDGTIIFVTICLLAASAAVTLLAGKKHYEK